MSNCGGSKTIFRSAQTLIDMRHHVDIVARKDNYTWDKHKPILNKIPKGYDAYVAISVSAIKPMLEVKGKHYFWMRGLEKWQLPKKEILHWCKKVTVIANSTWQINWLKKHNINATLCYAGLDLNFWKNLKESRTHIGGLTNKFHKTKHSEIVNKYCDVSIGGNFNDKQLLFLYNQCKIWLAPTTLEGFHNVPAEANLSGCLVVCNILNSNGMGDYANDETAMRYKTTDEIMAIIENPDYSKIEKMQDVLINKIGNRKKNMKKFLEVIG